jgi:hypothetical protein
MSDLYAILITTNKGQTMEIYILENTDGQTIGVFSTRELAQAYIDGMPEDYRWAMGITVATMNNPL